MKEGFVEGLPPEDFFRTEEISSSRESRKRAVLVFEVSKKAKKSIFYEGASNIVGGKALYQPL
jgi:hypothetical protein